MRRHLIFFAADVNRYSPLAIVSLATLACLPSLLSMLGGDLPATTALARYALSLVLATLAVRAVSSLVLRYAARNVVAAERQGPRPAASVKADVEPTVRQP